MKTVCEYDEEIATAYDGVVRLQKQIDQLRKCRERAFLRDHSGNLSDIEWLINNPTVKSQHDAMRKWMIDNVGGECNGVIASCYNQMTGQQCFYINFGWDAGEIEKNFGVRSENFKKFIALTLHIFKPNEDGVVSFGYATGEYSGCFDLEYDPSDASWSTSNTVYRRRGNVLKHDSLDAALAYAASIAMEIEG